MELESINVFLDYGDVFNKFRIKGVRELDAHLKRAKLKARFRFLSASPQEMVDRDVEREGEELIRGGYGREAYQLDGKTYLPKNPTLGEELHILQSGMLSVHVDDSDYEANKKVFGGKKYVLHGENDSVEYLAQQIIKEIDRQKADIKKYGDFRARHAQRIAEIEAAEDQKLAQRKANKTNGAGNDTSITRFHEFSSTAVKKLTSTLTRA